MNLSELKAGQGKVDVEVVVKSRADVRQFEKYGRQLRVCNAIVSDDSGNMTMSLWNDDIDKINVGDKIKITNGYVSEFNGTKQLSAGKFGKIEVVSSENKESKPAKSAEQAMDEITEDKKGKEKVAGEVEF